METGKDPLTNEIFIKKRSNQVFANRKNQIRFNNLKAKEKRKENAEINRILNKNQDILKSVLNGKEKVIKSYDFLLGAGFNFTINTHCISRKEMKWTCVYKYAYLYSRDRNEFTIIKLKDY